MNREFATVYGKVIIERNILYLRSPYLPFSKTAFAKFGYVFLLIFIFIVQFFRDNDARKYIGITIWGIFLITRLPEIYDILFRRSYASRIPLNRIENYTNTDDTIGLQTTVQLQLKNGRYKKILFRKLEHQAEPFIEAVSPFIA